MRHDFIFKGATNIRNKQRNTHILHYPMTLNLEERTEVKPPGYEL